MISLNFERRLRPCLAALWLVIAAALLFARDAKTTADIVNDAETKQFGAATGSAAVIASLAEGKALAGKIQKLELLGHSGPLEFAQDAE